MGTCVRALLCAYVFCVYVYACVIIYICVCVCVAHFVFVLSYTDAYFPHILYTVIPQHVQSGLHFGFNLFNLFSSSISSPLLLPPHLLRPFASSFSFHCLMSLSLHSYTGGTLLNLLSKFATCVSDGVDGKGSTDGGVEMNDLYGGARISYIFNEVRM